jgi:hypothetical protein
MIKDKVPRDNKIKNAKKALKKKEGGGEKGRKDAYNFSFFFLSFSGAHADM